MEHWFDDLSRRPQTRRTVMKAAAVAAGALIVPGLRTPRARATGTEPCFVPCNEAAAKRWRNQQKSCGSDPTYLLAIGGAAGPLSVIAVLQLVNQLRCMSSVEVDWHRDVIACRGSECGNSEKYPGGKVPKPKPKCDPGQEIVSGYLQTTLTSVVCARTVARPCAAALGAAADQGSGGMLSRRLTAGPA